MLSKPLRIVCSRSFVGRARNKYGFLTLIRRKNDQASPEPAVWDKSVKVIVVNAKSHGLLFKHSVFFGFEASAVASNSTRGF